MPYPGVELSPSFITFQPRRFPFLVEEKRGHTSEIRTLFISGEGVLYDDGKRSCDGFIDMFTYYRGFTKHGVPFPLHIPYSSSVTPFLLTYRYL